MDFKGVRIGPSSLVTLVAALLLAVLAMLCATSANAQSVMANREANSLEESYAVDSYGQCIVAGIDEQLHSGASSMNDVYQNFSALEEKAASETSHYNLKTNASLNNGSIQFSVAASNGRTLNASVSEKAGSISIDSWKLTTNTNQEDSELLWSSTANE